MATLEKNVILSQKQSNGDLVLSYPVTKADCVDGLDEKIKRTAGQNFHSETLSASGWSSGIYSFEGSYPSSSYDIHVEPNGDICTAEQAEAWQEAKILGSLEANKLKATGTVPTVDIPVIVKAVRK